MLTCNFGAASHKRNQAKHAEKSRRMDKHLLIYKLYRHMFERYLLEARAWAAVANSCGDKLVDIKLWAIARDEPLSRCEASLFIMWRKFIYLPEGMQIVLVQDASYAHTRMLTRALLRLVAFNYKMAIVANKITKQHTIDYANSLVDV
jgi:hypothetical protein